MSLWRRFQAANDLASWVASVPSVVLLFFSQLWVIAYSLKLLNATAWAADWTAPFLPNLDYSKTAMRQTIAEYGLSPVSWSFWVSHLKQWDKCSWQAQTETKRRHLRISIIAILGIQHNI